MRPSKRLTDSAVCLIADEGDMDVNLERLLKRHGQLRGGLPRVLEINPNHMVISKLAEGAKGADTSSEDLLKDAAHLLLDQHGFWKETFQPNRPNSHGVLERSWRVLSPNREA